jgi:hypothetical protein
LVEDLARHQQEPFSFETSRIVAWLVDEGHLYLPLEFAGAPVHELVVRPLEEMRAIDLNVHSPSALSSQFGMISEDELLGFEIQ